MQNRLEGKMERNDWEPPRQSTPGEFMLGILISALVWVVVWLSIVYEKSILEWRQAIPEITKKENTDESSNENKDERGWDSAQHRNGRDISVPRTWMGHLRMDMDLPFGNSIRCGCDCDAHRCIEQRRPSGRQHLNPKESVEHTDQYLNHEQSQMILKNPPPNRPTEAPARCRAG